MRLAQDDEMVHTLAPDRSDQPFGTAILPRRGWCRGLVPDAHGAQSACDDSAVDPIPIANEVLRRIIPRKCLSYWTRYPFCRRVRCDIDPDEVSAAAGSTRGGSSRFAAALPGGATSNASRHESRPDAIARASRDE